MRRITLLLGSLLGIFLFVQCDNDDGSMMDPLYMDIMAVQVKNELIDDASITPYAAIFDVSPAYMQGHLPFATNAGSVDGLGTMLDGLDKNLNYLVYCHADAPSMAGAELMVEKGFTKVYRLEGNYGAWDAVSFADIAADEVKSKIDAGDFKAIFDVSPHFAEGHLPGATNANAGAGGTDLSELIEGMDKTKTYLIYCHADSPSMTGAQLMEDAGFENVFRLEGNYGAWVEAGYDVEINTSLYMDIMAVQVKNELIDDASITPYAAIFDVSPAYTQGHLPFATNAGSVDGLGTMLDGLDKNLNYLVYCHADAPSMAGAELMVEKGFTKVYRLEGNYGAWDAVSFADIAADEVKSKIDAGDFKAIFDVSPNFAEGHLPGATNANSGAGGKALSELIEGMDKTKSYLVYCHGDGPAMAGAQQMEDAGFENVFRLEGNYGAWVSAGYPVE